jgi:Fic family protein
MYVPGQLLAGGRNATLNPDHPDPARRGLRYSLSPYTLGKLEKLARAKFEIGKFHPDEVIPPSTALWNIAQSVNASSEIEGEEVPASNLELALAAATEPSARRINEELEGRLAAISAIIKAQLWALFEFPREFISYEFVLELHQRMFATTKPHIAGRIKEHKVSIEGGGYNIKTLPPDKSELFLRRLCDRANDAFASADYSKFLITAEFVVDFLAIHPFLDGNGRTARLLSTYLLERSGYHFARFYPVDNVILERRSEYYEALFKAQSRWYMPDEDLSEWVEFYTNAVFNQYSRAFQKVKDANARQHQY